VGMSIRGTQNLGPGTYLIVVNKHYHIFPPNLILGFGFGFNINNNETSPDYFSIQILPRTSFDQVLIGIKNNASYASPLIVIAIITIASVLGPEFYTWFKKLVRPYVKGNNAAVEQVQNVHLQASDVLTVDGAVITGVLVLLSLTQRSAINQFVDVLNITQLLGHSLFTALTATIVYPFALSAIIVAIENRSGTSPKLGIRIMAAGFVYLIIALFFVGVFQF